MAAEALGPAAGSRPQYRPTAKPKSVLSRVVQKGRNAVLRRILRLFQPFRGGLPWRSDSSDCQAASAGWVSWDSLLPDRYGCSGWLVGRPVAGRCRRRLTLSWV